MQLRWGAPTPATYMVQAQDLSVRRPAWRTLARATRRRAGHTYSFRVRAVGGPFATTTTVVPSGARPAKGYYSPHWRTVRRHGAWQGRASRRALVAIKLRAGVHHLKLRVLGGLVALEGYGISARTG